MPIYHYRCEKCDKETEILRTVAEIDSPMTDEEREDTEECTHEYKRLIAPIRFYRGANWGTGKKGCW